MPAGALAQPLGVSVPATNAQLPFPMLVNGNEISGIGAEISSIRLRDPGFSGPETLDFTIYDHTNAVAPWIAKQQRVLWYDQVAGRYLFNGFVKELRRRIDGPWLEIDVSCAHMSECLDLSKPVDAWDAGTCGSSDQAEIQSLLANFCSEPNVGAGGRIQVLNASMWPTIPVDKSTLRNAISQVLGMTGVIGAQFYIDNLGRGHTMASGDISAPYGIIDAASGGWDGVTTCPALVEIDDQGAQDVDALWVNGATPWATGPVYAWQCGISTIPRSPLRWATLDAPQATDETGAIQAATVEFQTRQNLVSVSLTITGYNGWAKGQLITVTNSALGWVNRQFTISAVDMTMMSGSGIRQYKITAGSDPVLFTARLQYKHSQARHVAIPGQRVRGELGNSLSVPNSVVAAANIPPPDLQAAINAASPGATINATNGNYSGAFTINKALTIIGGTITVAASTTALTIAAGTDSLTLNGVTIKGNQSHNYVAAEQGVLVNGTSGSPVTNLTIKNCVINSLGGAGIWANFCSNFLFDKNTISDIFYAGIMVISGATGTVSNNSVARIGVGWTTGGNGGGLDANNCYGIVLSDTGGAASSYITVSGNTVVDVPTWHAFDTHSGSHCDFTSNTLYRCSAGIWIASVTHTAQYVTATGNTIGSPYPVTFNLHGSLVYNTDHVTINYNTFNGWGGNEINDAGGNTNLVTTPNTIT